MESFRSRLKGLQERLGQWPIIGSTQPTGPDGKGTTVSEPGLAESLHQAERAFDQGSNWEVLHDSIPLGSSPLNG
jgi:hypothetical protein